MGGVEYLKGGLYSLLEEECASRRRGVRNMIVEGTKAPFLAPLIFLSFFFFKVILKLAF